jgi:predicted ATPase/class 3 adenylate cyclase/DNA-binding CsgD family transcriptional regulator
MKETYGRPLLPLLHWGEPPMSETPPRTGDFVLPTGTVTLLLADVEGSTKAWESKPQAMKAAITRLDEVVDDILGAHAGVRPVEQGEGDSFVAAFSRASDALCAALAIQLTDLDPVRLRIGIHTGEVTLRDEGNYVGATISRAARIRNLGHGGQTLISQSAAELVSDHLPQGAWLVDAGIHRLRDLARPEHVFQLHHPDLQQDFPPLRSLDAHPHNLPVALTSFVGRHHEMAEVAQLLMAHRLVTLTGTGGCGKTRLALQVAADATSEHADGVWLIELAPISDPALVPTAVARALGYRDEPFRSTIQTLTHHLGAKTSLLILDNCEHLIQACALLTQTLLQSCPNLKVAATSREPMSVSGEVIYPVPPLALPGSEPAPIQALRQCEAVELFTERATRSKPSFCLTETNRAAVTEICRHLDGIPLAIELAAARIRVLSPEQIAAGVQDRFALLTGGTRTAMPRQQTLRASIDWSHQLLTEPERILFRRLGVSPGSFDLDAAQAVGAGEGLESHQVLDQLASLVDKSLVLADDADEGQTRYRLLETIRRYALEHIHAAGDEPDTRTRHRNHYLQFAETLGHQSGRMSASLEGLSPERAAAAFDDIRAAFNWSLEQGDQEQTARLACAPHRSPMATGLERDAREWLEVAVQRCTDIPTPVRVRLLNGATQAAASVFDPSARELSVEAVALAREVGERADLAEALGWAGAAAVQLLDPRAEAFLVEAVDIYRELGPSTMLARLLGTLSDFVWFRDPSRARALAEEGYQMAARMEHESGDLLALVQVGWAWGTALLVQGDLAAGLDVLDRLASLDRGAPFYEMIVLALKAGAMALMGEAEAAEPLCWQSIAIAEDAGYEPYTSLGRASLCLGRLAAGGRVSDDPSIDTRGISGAMARRFPGIGLTSEIALVDGDYETARRRSERAIEQAEVSGAIWQQGSACIARARVAMAEGQTDVAETFSHRALSISMQTGAQLMTVDALEILAMLEAGSEGPATRVRYLAVSARVRRSTGYVRFKVYRDAYDTAVSSARAALGDDEFDRAWVEGEAMSLDEAVAYAQRGRGERKRPASGWASLTPTEQQVARLVSEGMSNKEMAERLFVSPHTVRTHLQHVYSKLGVTSRVQLANQPKAGS